MMKNRTPAPAENTLLRLSLTRPISVCITFFLIILFIRWIDSFVLRMDERIGELILTKALGFGLVLGFVWLTGRKIRDIGLHSTFLSQSLLIGSLSTIVAFMIGYGAEFLFALQQGAQPKLLFDAIDPKMGVSGGALFALWLLLGNIVNSFMEEGFFRGLVTRLSRIRLSFWGANWFQAILFSIWHLPWVLKWYQQGTIETPGEIVFALVSQSIPMLIIGLIWGYYYLKTGNLWTSWISHLIANSTGNLLHVTTMDGLDSGLPLRMSVVMLVMLLSMVPVKRLAERYHMPEVKPWE